MLDNIRDKVVDIRDLNQIRENNADKKIVFCSGCFDILQSGHAVFFSKCKEYGDLLVVGVGRDEVISVLKGPGRPINPENNRLYLVAAMEDVDFAVLNDEIIHGSKIDFKGILECLRPDYFILNDDDGSIEEKTELCNTLGIEIKFVSRIVPPELEATSTKGIIDRINFKYKSPLRIDFAGGWSDVPYIMNGMKGYVSNVAISPLIEYKNGQFNFLRYPRRSGLSSSTASKMLEMISAKNYNADSKLLWQMGEDLFKLQSNELYWAIGRQDQYAIAYGGFNCFEFGSDYATRIDVNVTRNTLEKFRKNLLLLHTGISRNTQSAVEEVYKNFNTTQGKSALEKLSRYGLEFAQALAREDFDSCAQLMDLNFEAQIKLAGSTTNVGLDNIYRFAKLHGAQGGKIAGAGGGGAFIFYSKNPKLLKDALKKEFIDCLEIDFDFHYEDIKSLNKV